MTDHWTSQPDFPVEDWKYEVANDDTRLGYREWVENKRQQKGRHARIRGKRGCRP